MEEVKKSYYDGNPMLRYNPLWALVCGERSIGKSFWFKRRSINNDNLITIYLRRTDVLRKDSKNWKSYLSDLMREEVIDVDAEYKVNSEGIWKDGVQKVIFSALSTDSTAHSMTYLPDDMKKKNEKDVEKEIKKHKNDTEEDKFDYVIDQIDNAESTYDRKERKKLTKNIVFEEMLEPKGSYLKNEVELLFEFYVTVDRYENTQLFGLANLMTTYNPYFEYFGITPFTDEFKWFKNKTLLVQNCKIEGMEQFVKSQRFYNLVEGTSYGEYLCNNTPWQDDKCFLEKKPANSELVYNIRLNEKLYGIWYDGTKLYISTYNNKSYLTYAGLKSKLPNDNAIIRGMSIHRLLSDYSKEGNLRFENMTIRQEIYDVISCKFKEM